MIIEDEVAFTLVQSNSSSAFFCMSQCYYYQKENAFNAYCTSQMIAAAKLVQQTDDAFNFVRQRADLFDKLKRSISPVRLSWFFAMQNFCKEINSNKWLEMTQDKKIQATRHVFESWMHETKKLLSEGAWQ